MTRPPLPGVTSAYWLLIDGVRSLPGSLARDGDACASCRRAVPDCDAATTEAGQRLHRDGCPCDEPSRRELAAVAT